MKKILSIILIIALLCTAVFAANFSDVPDGKWYSTGVKYCASQGYVSGYTDGTFKPENNITRAELAAVMNKVLKLSDPAANSFKDVPAGAWYAVPVLKCVKAGVITGYGNNEFGPNDKVTREQAAVILAKAYNVANVSGRTSFADDASISAWAVGSVKAMAAKKLVSGTGNNLFSPKAHVTRGQICTMINTAENGPAEPTSRTEYDGLELTMLNVGQGLSILVNADGHYMLYDGGGRERSSYLVAYLKQHNISHLDYMFASHYDEDHIAGLVGVMNTTSVGKLITPNYETNTAIYRSFRSMVLEKGIQEVHPSVGYKVPLGDAELTVLGPEEYNPYDDNNNSLIVQIRYGAFSCLLTGDAELEEENQTVYHGRLSDVDLYVVGHHGSVSSSSNALLNAITPECAFISVGPNQYGHPREETLKKLNERGIKVYRSDLQGEVTLESDGKTYQIDKDPVPFVPASAETSQQTNPSETAALDNCKYILNTSSKKIHYPDCRSVASMSEDNKEPSNDSIENLEAQGYSPCGICNPK